MTKIDVLLGLQWGDEGKGKIVDALTPDYDVIARFQGGPNAGHTLKFSNQKYVLHTIPSGIFHTKKLNIIGNGVVIDPSVFLKEMDIIRPVLPDIEKNLIISSRAHLILPTHRLLDEAYEKEKGMLKIGSTLKGIGPAYTDKTARVGIRAGDIQRDDFRSIYDSKKAEHLKILNSLSFKIEGEFDSIEKEWFNGINLLKKFRIENSEYLINELYGSGSKILAEGAQGTMLDIDFGSYPFVTSSNTISAGACIGMGIAPGLIGEVYGIFKAYCTRVGSGPFPTELNNPTGEKLRKQGHEFGATTGRPRRCGWLDLPALKYSIMINGVTTLFMTKADVMSGFDTIKICRSYRINGIETDQLPYDHNIEIEPVYTNHPGWSEDVSGMKSYHELPANLRSYIDLIEKETGIPVSIVSVGPDRNETIYRD